MAHEDGTDDVLSVGDVIQVPGLEGDHQVDALYPDGIGLSPEQAPALDPAPATAPQAA